MRQLEDSVLTDHLPGGYVNGGCRCADCRASHARKAREQYRKMKAKRQAAEAELMKLRMENIGLRAALQAVTGQPGVSMSNTRKLWPQSPVSAQLAALDGAHVPGGCDHCGAYQVLNAMQGDPDVHMISVYHDDWCPELAARQEVAA